MTYLYTIDHSRVTGHLRNYDPIKQYFCLLQNIDISRPLFVLKEYLIHFDAFLQLFDVPTKIATSLTVIKHLVSAPLNDSEKSDKQTNSYKEIFISAKVISYIVKAGAAEA